MEKKSRHSPFAFFYNQKIGTKILAGYLVAFLLAAVVGGLAIYQFQRVSATIYQLTGRLAQERNLAEETAIQIHLIRLYANQYIQQGQNPVDLEVYNQALGDAQGLLNEADQVITEKSRVEMQVQVRSDFNSFAAAFAEIVQLLAARQATVNEVLTPQGTASVEKLAVLRDNSFENLDFTTAHFASQARDTFSQMQVNVSQFLATGNEQYAGRVDTDHASISSTFDLLRASVRNDTSRRQVNEIEAAAAAYYAGFQNARAGIARQHELTTKELDTFGPKIDQNTTVIANDINQEFTAQSQATSAFVTRIQNLTIFTIILLVIVGLIFGLILSRVITKPIEEMARAAQEVARGVYDLEVEVQGKDELGILAGAFNHMTARVQEMLTALGESTERYFTLFEAANDAIFVMEGEVFLECNQKTVELFGCADKSEVIGRTPVDFSPALQPDGRDTREKAKELIRATLGGAPQFFYWKHQRKDLALIDTEVSLNNLSLNGKTYLQAIVRDISERKKAEESVRQSEEKYRSIFENAFEGIYQSTPQGRFLNVNPAEVRMFGYASAEEMINSITDISQQIFAHPEDRNKMLELLNQKGFLENYEIENLRKDGQSMWVSLNLHIVRDADGAVLYYQGAALDITKRKQMEQSLIERSHDLTEMVARLEEEITERLRAEEALRESENRYRTLAEATFEGIVISENGLIVDANQQLAQMYGYSLPEVMGMYLLDFLMPEEGERVANGLATGEERIGEYRARRKDGSGFFIEAHGRVFEINQRKVRITSVRDITERVRAEEALRQDAQRSAALARISTRLNASLGLQEVLDAVCEEIALMLEAPIATLWLLDDELKSLHLKAAFGVSPEIVKQIQPIPNRVHPLWQEKLENIYYVPDVQEIEDNNNGPLIHKLGLHTTLHCLFYHEGQQIGVLMNSRYESGWNYSEADLTLMQTLSNQVAIAIHHAQLYEQVKSGRERLQAMSEKLVDIQETERRHLAIELHDEIGQALTHIKMSLDRYDPAHPEKGSLESAREMAIDLMKRVRSLSLELRPTILDDLGLLPAVLWHIERYTALSGIQVDFKPSGMERRFRAQVESTAYRILQESLTNIARHAGATRVTISLWADEERLGLQVEDNGAGFDPAATLQKMTGGLSGMQERARICGGQLLIDSRPGQGTYISLELPLQGEFIERRSR